MTPKLRSLRREVGATLDRVLEGAGTAALADFPTHHNIGDSLIYMGHRRLLTSLNVQLSYVCDHASFRPEVLRTQTPDVVLLQGGGSLGDRYPMAQEFRERVIRTMPDFRIIQLPQSVDFSSPAAAAECRAVFEAHPDFTLMVRERKSLEKARELFPKTRIEYSPDHALAASVSSPSRGPCRDVVGLGRTDGELNRDHSLCALVDRRLSCVATDWKMTTWSRLGWRFARIPGKLHSASVIPYSAHTQALFFDLMAQIAVSNGARILSEGRVILTDRLHATILALLIGRPVVALDNSTGKVGSVYASYLSQFSGVVFARQSDAANSVEALL